MTMDLLETLRTLTLAQEMELERLLGLLPLVGSVEQRADRLARGLETWRWVQERGDALEQTDPNELRTRARDAQLEADGSRETLALRLRAWTFGIRTRKWEVRDPTVLRLLDEPWQLSLFGLEAPTW